MTKIGFDGLQMGNLAPIPPEAARSRGPSCWIGSNTRHRAARSGPFAIDRAHLFGSERKIVCAGVHFHSQIIILQVWGRVLVVYCAATFARTDCNVLFIAAEGSLALHGCTFPRAFVFLSMFLACFGALFPARIRVFCRVAP